MAMQACPRCGVKVKAANVGAHTERVHPQPGSRRHVSASERAEAALVAEGCPAALARAAVFAADDKLEQARRALADPELRAWVPMAHALDAAQLFPVPEALEEEAAALLDAWLAQPGLEEGVRNELEWRRAPLPGGYLAPLGEAADLFEDGRLAEALSVLEAMGPTPTDEPSILLEEFAEALHDEGRTELAERAWRALLRREPNHGLAALHLAALLQGQERLPEAVAVLEDALQRDPGEAMVRLDLARVLGGLGQAERAARLCEEGLGMVYDPEDWDVPEILEELRTEAARWRGQAEQPIAAIPGEHP